MKKSSKVIAIFVVLAILVIGVGYAAITSVTLNITGTAAADPSDANFNVKFSGTPEKSDARVTAKIESDPTLATMNVEGLTKKNETVSATFTIENASPDLSANLTPKITSGNTADFEVTQSLGKALIEKGEKTTITVTVKLLKTPINDNDIPETSLSIEIDAQPVQP